MKCLLGEIVLMVKRPIVFYYLEVIMSLSLLDEQNCRTIFLAVSFTASALAFRSNIHHFLISGKKKKKTLNQCVINIFCDEKV